VVNQPARGKAPPFCSFGTKAGYRRSPNTNLLLLGDVRRQEAHCLSLECNFLLAGPTGDAVNLALISLRLGGRRLF
jgi:hypothetical protein